jgi:Lipopolysaccharide kinase (Kdo/WaaP) family
MAYDLESIPPNRSWSSKGSTYESWVPHAIPNLPKDVVIKEWEQFAVGTHGMLRRARLKGKDFDKIYCLKLFSEEYRDEYEREEYAYSLLIHRGVHHCIPAVYWKAELPLTTWEGATPSGLEEDSNTLYCGLVMEYFDDVQIVNFETINLPTAEAVARSLAKLHQARVRHGDFTNDNILLVRQSENVRIVFIDFSCAWVNTYRRPLQQEWSGFMATLKARMVGQCNYFY